MVQCARKDKVIERVCTDWKKYAVLVDASYKGLILVGVF
jgi:hypothetical protein